MKTGTRYLVSAVLIGIGLALVLFWRQAAREFSEFGATTRSTTYEQVVKSFPTYAWACRMTAVDPLPPQGVCDPVVFSAPIARRVQLGIMVGQGVVVWGSLILLPALLGTRYQISVRVQKGLVIALIAFLVLNGLWVSLRGPSGKVMPFGSKPASN